MKNDPSGSDEREESQAQRGGTSVPGSDTAAGLKPSLLSQAQGRCGCIKAWYLLPSAYSST